MRAQFGMSLIEVLIALILGAFILTAFMTQYLSIKQHNLQLLADLDRLSETQLAMDMMRDSIRQAGFTPCLSLQQLIIHPRTLPAIEVVDDTLRINRMSDTFDELLSVIDSTHVRLTQVHRFSPSTPILIADCHHAEIHDIQSVNQAGTTQLMTFSEPLFFHYAPPVYVGEWVHESYFVRKKAGLFYQRTRADALAPQIIGLSATLNGAMVHVDLELKTHPSVRFNTSLRQS